MDDLITFKVILELTNITDALKNIPQKWKKIENLTLVSLKN